MVIPRLAGRRLTALGTQGFLGGLALPYLSSYLEAGLRHLLSCLDFCSPGAPPELLPTFLGPTLLPSVFYLPYVPLGIAQSCEYLFTWRGHMPTGENISIVNYYNYFFQFQVFPGMVQDGWGLGRCITKFPHDADAF